MELSLRARDRSWRRLSCLGAFLLIAGCEAEATTTGVRLAISYGQVPARLQVDGRAGADEHYGPELLPNPPRPLRSEGETVVLLLSDELAGRTLTLEVLGFDASDRVIGRAVGQVRVVQGAIVQSVLHLTAAADCDEAGVADDAGNCEGLPPPEGDAGAMPTTHEPDVLPPDLELPKAGASSPATPDASTPAVLPDGAPLDAGPLVPGPLVEMPTAGSGAPSAGSGGAPATVDAGMVDAAGDDAGGPCANSSCGDGMCCVAAGEDSCSCDKDCGAPAAGSCSFACGTGKCTFDCKHAKTCSASCSGNADCTIKCAQTGDCSAVSCAAPASCILECEGSTKCGFALCPSGAMSCPKNKVACNHPCPP